MLFLTVIVLESIGLIVMFRNSRRDSEGLVGLTKELETLAAENAQLYAKTKDALVIRDEFLSVASHELKTPLTALLMQLQLIARHLKGDGRSLDLNLVQGLTEKTIHHGTRLASLMDQLSDLTRINSGKLQLQPAQFDFKNLIQDVVSQLSTEAMRKGSAISFHAESFVSSRFDPLRIQQVMTNLISNAIKYGNGKPVDVSLKRSVSEVEIKVRDWGLGIAKEKHGIIFERFERVHAEASNSSLGLGLYIAQQIVAAYQGKILVQSDVGKGSLFTVKLPI